jgi:hypothetical protein
VLKRIYNREFRALGRHAARQLAGLAVLADVAAKAKQIAAPAHLAHETRQWR